MTHGPIITGPIIHGTTDQHSRSGHLQLAQQLTGVMGHSSSGLTLFGPSALHFYQGFTSSTLSMASELLPLPPNPSLLAGLSQVSFSPSLGPSPASKQPQPVSLGQSSPPTHGHHSTTQPIHAPPQIYTNPIISLPPSPPQIYCSQTSKPSYLNAPNPHPLPSRTYRSSTRHHPYQRKSSVLAA